MSNSTGISIKQFHAPVELYPVDRIFILTDNDGKFIKVEFDSEVASNIASSIIEGKVCI